ncbi:MAG: hypothetical protein KJ706_08385 [Candidatus Omnitrophica bacterium]|nr:hypothetical protein [Candidatus Omnitrophota bacterium]
MDKGFAKKVIFSLFFLVSSCASAQSMHLEINENYFGGEVESTVEVFIFDGIKLSPIDRESKFFRKKIPVTEGNYFAIFFIKEGFIPEVKVLLAGKKDIKIGKIRLKKMIYEKKGFLVGVVYKPIHGGKVSLRKGIVKLIGRVDINVVCDKRGQYITRARDDGVYSIQLVAGKYKLFISDNKDVLDVIIKKGKTTIQNLQKGMMLID